MCEEMARKSPKKRNYKSNEAVKTEKLLNYKSGVTTRQNAKIAKANEKSPEGKLTKTIRQKLNTKIPLKIKEIVIENSPKKQDVKKEQIKGSKSKEKLQNCEKKILKVVIERNIESHLVPLKQKLRKRITKNCNESSIGNSIKQSDKQTNKLPIYKQEIKEKSIEANDLYEFDSDTEKQKKKRKRRKLNGEGNKQKRTNKKTNNNKSEEYNETIEKIMKNVRIKINNKKDPLIEKTTNKPITVNNNKNANISKIANTGKENNNTNSSNNQALNESIQNNSKIKIVSDIHLKNYEICNENSKLVRENNSGLIKDVRLESDENSVLIPNANSTMIVTQKPKKVRSSPWRFTDRSIVRNPHFLQLKSSGLPNVSQEMVLDHSLIVRFNESTMRSCIESGTKTPKHLMDLSETPERVEDVHDTPERVQDVSETSKCIAEEKTPEQVEKEAKTPSKVPESPKRVRQTTLLEFYGNTEQINKENLQVSTLFDDHHFSPIKTLHKRILLNKNNLNILSSTPLKDNNDIIEESYFGFDKSDEIPIDESVKKPFRFSVPFKKYKNTEQTQTNENRKIKRKNDQSPKEKSVKEESLNGRKNKRKIEEDAELSKRHKQGDKNDEKTDSNEMNECTNKKTDENSNEPMKKRKRTDAIDENLEEELTNYEKKRKFEFSSSEEELENEENSEEIQLFLDPEVNQVSQPMKIYKKKQKWMKFVMNEPEEEEEKIRKKKRKEMRTKSEEEEAEKWAEAFNSMCKEVEEFPLEIE